MTQMDNMFLNACKNGQKGVAQALLAKGGIDVNKRDPLGFTALHYASQKGARDLVSMLIANGADASACSNDSTTPLHMVSRSGNKDVIRMLLDAGADVVTCPLQAILGLLKHPLTESGLAQFLADHARVNQE